jgi:hypothetical protein
MNKQLILLAALFGAQISMQAVDMSVLKDGAEGRSYFETIKNGLIQAKDTTVAYVTSFRKPTWQEMKDFAAQAKDSTLVAASNAYASVKENAPVYAEKAKEFVKENPKLVAGASLALVGTYFFYKAYESYIEINKVKQFSTYLKVEQNDDETVKNMISAAACYSALKTSHWRKPCAQRYFSVFKIMPEDVIIKLSKNELVTIVK